MIILKHPVDIYGKLNLQIERGRSIGFVPTMGALHHGHLSLIKNAHNDTEIVVCSIFVNPMQFNDPIDFKKYPSTVEHDIYLLEKAGCDLLYVPSVTDMYPEGNKMEVHYDLGLLENVLEGKYRPGHFQGVCQAVHRLLKIVQPTTLFLGQKDFQQCLVIKKMIQDTGIKTAVKICPTLRENDGLAMSSRNIRLNESERKKAPTIFKALQLIEKGLIQNDLEQLIDKARKLLIDNGFKVDYVEIAHTDTLEPLQQWNSILPVVILIAAYLNEVRLIDNIVIQPSHTK